MPAAVSIDVPIERPSRTSKRTGIRNLESAATGGTGESAGPLCVAVSSDELGRRRRSMTSRTYVSKIVALPTESKEVKETGRRWRHYAGPTLIRRGGRLSIVVPPVPCSTTKRAGFSLSMAAIYRPRMPRLQPRRCGLCSGRRALTSATPAAIFTRCTPALLLLLFLLLLLLLLLILLLLLLLLPICFVGSFPSSLSLHGLSEMQVQFNDL